MSTITVQDSIIEQKNSDLKQVIIENEAFYKISNSDAMRPFFMSIVSDSDHWMFISSNGGLSAGRKNSSYSLFPYYTDDKLTELAHNTGSRTILHISKNNNTYYWEPFVEDVLQAKPVTRNVYKSVYGNSVLFEEINNELELTFRYHWCNSDEYGFVRRCSLVNESANELSIKLLDGIQNIMPQGVNPDLQIASSNLVDAYKRNQLHKESGLGMYALSAIIVDRAEPSEALKTNMVWSLGLNDPTYLVSSLQLNKFRINGEVAHEQDIKAEKGAYFMINSFTLKSNQDQKWMIIAELNKDISDVKKRIHDIKNDKELKSKVLKSIVLGTSKLKALVAASDGIQLTADKKQNSRHFSNTLFNIMRGGIFDDNYTIEKQDFIKYLRKANKIVFQKNSNVLNDLPVTFHLEQLKEIIKSSDDPNFKRLAIEYLPLKFSRRHGDPSRPWNKFSINLKNEDDDSKILDYEGNWRDIFQNWEALAKSYPAFLEGMIFKFLNASTFDGYNPYRVTKDGFDWEVIEEHDPWSYIGYWGDHQIIYLLKFLELIQDHNPEKLANYFNKDVFVYANVPYKIKSYREIVQNPKDTIEFDYEGDIKIRKLRDELGADGALLRDKSNSILRVNFIEKMMATALAKVSNFIPEAGIWMNTQRPEWNDANNALVGNGVSMVTLYYLRRFFNHFYDILSNYESQKSVDISVELYECYLKIREALKDNSVFLDSSFTDSQRRTIQDKLGTAASNYRIKVYEEGFSGVRETLKINQLKKFITLTLEYLDHSIVANKRADNMYHAYNLVTLNANNTTITYLDEMLEGQVAVLSAGKLEPIECLEVLDAMKASRLFREDQYSYILYPNKDLPGFLEKNTVPTEAVGNSKLLTALIEDGNTAVIERDINGNFHFNGNFNNANSLKVALNDLKNTGYSHLVEKESDQLFALFEEVFNHKAFTGRSGTFYGYEGLGSIYWHMVSKLLLAVKECCLQAINQNTSEEIVGRLLEHFYEINEGIGVHKSPELYGAFPTDPYSHTPAGKGAQQPGMTGQVKEDILSRIGELGVFVKNGQLTFNPCLLRAAEFLKKEKDFSFINVNQEPQEICLKAKSIAFTYCQVPIVYKISKSKGLIITYSDGRKATIDAWQIDKNISQKVFNRTNEIYLIEVTIPENNLK